VVVNPVGGEIIILYRKMKSKKYKYIICHQSNGFIDFELTYRTYREFNKHIKELMECCCFIGGEAYVCKRNDWINNKIILEFGDQHKLVLGRKIC
jgi:hypothetical protein